MSNNTRLGKGLSTIFGQNYLSEEVQENEQIVEIELERLKENPYQPRKIFDEEKIDELAQSIKEHGVFQPIIVKQSQNSFYIVAGERRFRACKKIGLQSIPAIVRDISDKTMAEIALLENLQRENLTLIEEAFAYKMLIEKYSLTQQEVAERVGKSRAHIANALRLLNLPENVQDMVSSGDIEFGHGKILAGLDDEEQIVQLANQIKSENLTVRALEQLLKESKEQEEKVKEKQEKKKVEVERDVHIDFLENELIQKLGTNVKIVTKEVGGKVVINYSNDNDLNRLLDLMNLIEE
jgi:ParB family chromosome partitioning protein